jgi:hypothetical protein
MKAAFYRRLIAITFFIPRHAPVEFEGYAPESRRR